MEKEYLSRIDNLIALCHILDDFLEFEKKLRAVITMKNNREFVLQLWDISKGKFHIGAKRAKKFYRENKSVIDTINQYSYLTSFINGNYDAKGNPVNSNSLQFFYEYILKHKSEMDNILAVLLKLKELGFDKIKFNEKIDFASEKYKINKCLNQNSEFVYLDQMEAIPHYDSNVMEYRTNGSSYKISIEVWFRDFIRSYTSHEIILNSLTFHPSRLPNSLSKEETFNKIIGLCEQKQQEYSAIKNSVELNASISDLYLMADVVTNKINDLNHIEKKEELIKLLTIIREAILKMQTISSEYDEYIVNANPSISEKDLEEEKKSYARKKQYENIDFC